MVSWYFNQQSRLLSRDRTHSLIPTFSTQAQHTRTGSELFRYLVEVLQPHLPVMERLLHRYLIRRKADRFVQTGQRSRLTLSPIPIQPSKRDLVLPAAGMPSLHYHNQVPHINTERQGLTV